MFLSDSATISMAVSKSEMIRVHIGEKFFIFYEKYR